MSITAVILAIIALCAGTIAGWVFANGRASARLAILGAALDTEKAAHAKAVQDCREATGRRDEYQQAKSLAENDCAGWKKGYEEKTAELRRCREEHLDDLLALRNERDGFRREKDALDKKISGLEEREAAVNARLAGQQVFMDAAGQKLKDAFEALSAQALKNNNESFVSLAQARLEEKMTDAKGQLERKEEAISRLVKPLGDSLQKMDEKINAMETKREGAYTHIATIVEAMRLRTDELDKGTRSLVGALKTSHTRGRWGEIALRRLVEFAGMTDYCDFAEQESIESESGRLRPDMMISMPEGRRLPVDSKVPFDAYYALHETEDADAQKACLSRHVEAVRKHVKDLSLKAYWDQFRDTPDFVVMYMHVESSFGAALQACPSLIEEALAARIIIATPTTLITILKSVSYSWQQRSTMANIDAIRDAAVQLYERSCVLAGHLQKLGKSLGVSVGHYNSAVGSLEGSFLPQGRKIAAMAAGYVKTREEDMPLPLPVESATRELSAQYPQAAPAAGVALTGPGFETATGQEAMHSI